jgi:histidine triad (HIT) family protein
MTVSRETHDMIYLSHMKTIFEKIIDREIPADIIYEDDTCMAFLDVHPQSKGHTLLVPKTPYGRIQFVPAEILGELMIVAQKIIKIMIQNLDNCEYVQVEMVGVGVPDHFHIHLIPRLETDIIPESPYQEYSDQEKQYYIEQLKKLLN